MKIEVEIKSFTNEVVKEFNEQLVTALEEVGRQMESNAKLEIEGSVHRSSDGRLRNSITHNVKPGENAVYIGSNVFYSIYVHEGTGIYAPNASTSGKTWWVFVKGSKSSSIKAHGKRYSKYQAYQVMEYLRNKGLDAWMTQGQKPNRFMTRAVEKYRDEYKKIIETIMKS